MHFPTLSVDDPSTGGPRPSASADYPVRYEDIAQDGRLKLEAVPQGVGYSVWRTLLRNTPLPELARKAHIAAIPSRFCIESTGGPISVRNHLQATSSYQLARAESPDGQVTRLLMNFYTDIFGTVERSYDPQPDNRGERVHVGRIFSEQVWTRPFAPAGQRKVLSLPSGIGPSQVPEEVYPWRPPAEASQLPPGASWLEPGETPDEIPLRFGVVHTDSNQHVNSLVYPRVLEEAALRRLVRLGLPFDQLGRQLELSFGRPCFAGKTYRLMLRAFRLDESARIGVCARLLDPVNDERGHCFARLVF